MFLLLLLLCSIKHTWSVPVRQYNPAFRTTPIPPASLVTELDNKYIYSNVTLPSNHQTALILIDVWDDHSTINLYDNQNLRILPLLAYARQQNWFIVHAPSENKETSMISVLPGELLVTGVDARPGSKSLCFPHLVNHSVTHVLIAGYDTNYCVLDKPCGTISTSKAAAAAAATTANATNIQVLLVRDATLPQSQWYDNDYYSYMTSINMIEAAAWLPTSQRYIRSLTVTDLVLANPNILPNSSIYINATTKLKYPMEQATSSTKPFAPIPINLMNNTTAFVVVSCSDDEYDVNKNDGYRARMLENKQLFLEPLIEAVRERRVHIIHVPNGHSIQHSSNNICTPLLNEPIINTTLQFDTYIKTNSIHTLIYVGYAANRDMLHGIAGMQRYYSNSRYLYKKIPNYYWIQETTIGFETGKTLAGDEWAKKQALAYRQPLVTKTGNILSLNEVMSVLEKSVTPFARAATVTTKRVNDTPLPLSELNALLAIYHTNGGQYWKYNKGTDAVGGGRPWNITSSMMTAPMTSTSNVPNPCMEGWFGIECKNGNVVKLFINTRYSGNPLINALAPEIGNLTQLEHFYSSNDKTPSSLTGGIPSSFGQLIHLKCMYFSHNNLTLPFPKSLENLSQLQVFLARSNSITGSLLNFSKFPLLRNVWFDGNKLEGDLYELGKLKNLTFLKVDGNRLTGDVPMSLCNIKCDASKNAFNCPLPVKGCCGCVLCGDRSHVPIDPPRTSMGECVPQ